MSTILTDAGQYVCHDWNTDTFASANLAVIAGQPRCNTNSTMPTLPNDTVSILCQVDIIGSTSLGVSLTQGGKTLATGNSSTVTWNTLALNIITDIVMCVAPAGISSTQCPTIQVKPGNIAVNNVKSEFFVNDVLNCSAVGSSPLFYQWTTNTTVSIAPGPVLVVNKNMAGPVLFQCTVNNDYGNTQTSIAAMVIVPVTDITISSQDRVHYAGDVITCEAAGYPLPKYIWYDVNNSSIRVSGPVFNITSSMIGMNFTLICTATNVVDGSTRNISSTLVSFTVVGGLPPPSSTTVASSSVNTSSSNTTAIIAGVVCGVGGAAIIILVVILIVFCSRRQKHDHRLSTTGIDIVFAETNMSDNTSTYQGLNAATRDTQTLQLYEPLNVNTGEAFYNNVFAERKLGDNTSTYQGLDVTTRDTQTPKLYESLNVTTGTASHENVFAETKLADYTST